MKGPDEAKRSHDVCTLSPPLQTGSSLKLPTGQFLNGRSPQDERARRSEAKQSPAAPPLSPPLQTGSSLKLPTGQFLNGRSPQDERARRSEAKSRRPHPFATPADRQLPKIAHRAIS